MTWASRRVVVTGGIVWDTSRPNGQPRRCADASLAKRVFGFAARTHLREGIRRAIARFLAHRCPPPLAAP